MDWEVGTDDQREGGEAGERERECYAGFAPDRSKDCSESVGYVCIQDCDWSKTDEQIC